MNSQVLSLHEFCLPDNLRDHLDVPAVHRDGRPHPLQLGEQPGPTWPGGGATGETR